MERLQQITLILILLSACSHGSNRNAEFLIAREISGTSTYYEARTIVEVENFVKENHQNSDCRNDLLEKIFDFYSFLDKTQLAIASESGYDVNGRLAFAGSSKISADLLEKVKFDTVFTMFFYEIKNLCFRSDIYEGEMVFARIEDNTGIFKLEPYAERNLDNLSVVQLYNDLLLVKSGLLFTEMMYFELLISNGQCSGNEDF